MSQISFELNQITSNRHFSSMSFFQYVVAPAKDRSRSHSWSDKPTSGGREVTRQAGVVVHSASGTSRPMSIRRMVNGEY
jgi:hypothetical protein